MNFCKKYDYEKYFNAYGNYDCYDFSCNSFENMNGYDDMYSCKSYTKSLKSLKELSELHKRLDSLLTIYKKQNPQLFILRKAEKELRKYHFYGNNIANKKIIFLNDSMCVISFIYKSYDDSNLGRYLERYSQLKFEYTLVKLRKGSFTGETIYHSMFLDVDIEKKYSIKETIDYIDNGFLYGIPEYAIDNYSDLYFYYGQGDDNILKLLKEKYDNYIKNGMSKEDAKANCLYLMAIANSDTFGQDIVFKD